MALGLFGFFWSWIITFFIIIGILVALALCCYLTIDQVQSAPEKIDQRTRFAALEADNQVQLMFESADLYGGLKLPQDGERKGSIYGAGKYTLVDRRTRSGTASGGIAPHAMGVHSADADRKRRQRMRWNHWTGLAIVLVWFLGMQCSLARGELQVLDVQTQLDCTLIPGLDCRPDDFYHHVITASVPLDFESGTIFERQWYVVPLMRGDRNSGLNTCDPALVKECLLVSGGAALVQIEVGTFRWAHTIFEAPKLEFPYDYLLQSENISGVVDGNATACPSEPADTSILYSDTSDCVAAYCNCTGQNSSITEMYPLLPACGLFPVKQQYPRPSTWVLIVVTNLQTGLSDRVFIPDVRQGTTQLSRLGRLQFKATNFSVPGYPEYQYPARLTGGPVICNWQNRTSAGGNLYLQVENPELDPMDQGWYYVSAATIADEYRGHECGQNGVNSQEIYGFNPPKPFCCTNASVLDYARGACIPQRTPEFMLTNKSAGGFPPLSFEGSDNYWVTSNAGGFYQLLRQPSASEFPAGSGQPLLEFELAVSDKLALSKNLGQKILIPAGVLQDAVCNFAINLGYGVVTFEICNEAMHVSIPAGTEARVGCTNALVPVQFPVGRNFTLRDSIEPGLCRSGGVAFDFLTPPINISLMQTFFNPFAMTCTVDLVVQNTIIDVPVNVTLATLQNVACNLLGSTWPAIVNATEHVCDKFDYICQIARGQLDDPGNTWGVVYLATTCGLVLILIVLIIALAVKASQLRTENDRIAMQAADVAETNGEFGAGISADAPMFTPEQYARIYELD